MPAPPTCPLRTASASASSSTRPPRAALTISTPGLVSASWSLPMRPRVSGVLGRWIEIMSARRSSSSRLTSSMPSCAARAGATYGSKAISRTSKAARRCATSWPILPRPTTPTVLPFSSTPVYALRFHCPLRRLASAAGMCRAVASSRAIACSAAETMFDVGALTTITPRAVAAGTSTLSRPTPARATTFSRVVAASASASTLVADRTSSASASASAPSRAGRSVPSTWRISTSSPSIATAEGASFSASRTTGRRAVAVLTAVQCSRIGDGGLARS